jgi:16S rRNA (cytosine1402-N4)-methyltransferase
MNNAPYLNHISVMKEEVLFLASEVKKKTPIIVDGTFGFGGHTFSFLDIFPDASIYSCDQDQDAINAGQLRISNAGAGSQIKLFKTNFVNFPELLRGEGINEVDIILLDIGVSSHQFDSDDRGFSFRKDAPLDMRMDKSENVLPASYYLNELSQEELENVIKVWGEDSFYKKIASGIVEERKKNPILLTEQLENICFHAYPKALRHKRIHPATKTFMALRILVNKELEVLENCIPKYFDLLSKNGILMIISFHSLEDRIVKHTFKNLCSKVALDARILTKRPMIPTDDEIERNSRSRSAKLRAIMK